MVGILCEPVILLVLQNKGMLGKKRNIIFDLDGTLWNTVTPCTVGWNKALEQINHADWKILDKDLQTMVGKSQLEIFAGLFPNLKKEEIPIFQKLCDECQSEAIKEMGGDIYPNVLKTIDKIIELGKKVFIVSNCEDGYIELFFRPRTNSPANCRF